MGTTSTPAGAWASPSPEAHVAVVARCHERALRATSRRRALGPRARPACGLDVVGKYAMVIGVIGRLWADVNRDV